MPDLNTSFNYDSGTGNLVIQSALHNFAMRMVTWALSTAGAALVTYGAATADQVNQVEAPLATIIVGGIFSIAGATWAAHRASRQRQREININNAPAGSVPIK